MWWSTSGRLVYQAGAVIRSLLDDTSSQSLSNKTLVNPIMQGVATEDVYTIPDGPSVALDPANGGIQLWTLGANRTPNTAPLTQGEWMLLLVDDGAGFTLTLSGIVWMNNGGVAPTLKAAGYTPILIINDGPTQKGWLAGTGG